MSLRLRIAIYAFVMVGVVVGSLYLGASRVLLGSFTQLEDKQMLKNLDRAERAWDGELARMASLAADYAAWDDTYRYVADHNAAYASSNLNSDIVTNLGVNLLAYVDRAGTLVSAETVNLETGTAARLPDEVRAYLAQPGPLLRHTGVRHRPTGLVVLPGAVLLAASAPIVTSDYRGPVRGSVVMAKFLSGQTAQSFSALTRMRVRFYRLDDDTLPDAALAARDALLVRGGRLSRTLDETKMAGYTLLPDLTGKPALLLQIQAPRTIYAQARRSRRTLTTLMLAVGGATSAALLLFLQRGVLARFGQLSAALGQLAASGDATRRLRVTGRDEVARVGRDVDRMLASLEAAQRGLRESEARYARAASGVNDGLWDWSLQTGEVYYSGRFAAMLGHPEVPRVGDADFFFGAVHPDDLGRVRAQLGEHLAGRTPGLESEFRALTPAGFRWMLLRGLAVFEGGAAVSVTGSLTDISGRGLFDPLTGLPNRLLLMNRLGHVQAARAQTGGAALFLDLNRFKVINDSLGHHVGDLLLTEVARRLQALARQGDTVARLGGDEFVVLLAAVAYDDVTRFSERVSRTLACSYEMEGHRVEISASIGVVWPLPTEQGAEDVLRDADVAMYEAKKSGAPFLFFEPAMLERAVTRQRLEEDLRGALGRRELFLVYQPVVSSKAGTVTTLEALVRWRHPQRGLVSPEAFVPLAEETGLIVPLGRWVLEEVCRQLQEADERLGVAVNLSPRQLADPGLVAFVTSLLAETGVAPARLTLEVTESAVMAQPDRATGVLAELRGLGVRLALDDFGTGYASLNHLHDLPVSVIKIDRAFVTRLTSGDKSLEIVRTIMTLAERLGLLVVAEGVETEAQRALLEGLGCGLMQGFLYSGPLPWDDAVRFGQSTASAPRSPPEALPLIPYR